MPQHMADYVLMSCQLVGLGEGGGNIRFSKLLIHCRPHVAVWKSMHSPHPQGMDFDHFFCLWYFKCFPFFFLKMSLIPDSKYILRVWTKRFTVSVHFWAVALSEVNSVQMFSRLQLSKRANTQFFFLFFMSRTADRMFPSWPLLVVHLMFLVKTAQTAMISQSKARQEKQST